MYSIDIPGFGRVELKHLVLDFNGTIACDGELMHGVAHRLELLKAKPYELDVHVVTADTRGTVKSQFDELTCRCSLFILDDTDQAQAKQTYVQELGARHVMAVGNGRNDRLMLAEAGLGVAVLCSEGTASAAVQAADIVCRDILCALDLLLHPLRLTATLRS